MSSSRRGPSSLRALLCMEAALALGLVVVAGPAGSLPLLAACALAALCVSVARIDGRSVAEMAAAYARARRHDRPLGTVGADTVDEMHLRDGRPVALMWRPVATRAALQLKGLRGGEAADEDRVNVLVAAITALADRALPVACGRPPTGAPDTATFLFLTIDLISAADAIAVRGGGRRGVAALMTTAIAIVEAVARERDLQVLTVDRSRAWCN